MQGHWAPAAAVGSVSLCAHLLDYAVTLRMSPTLGAEGNPIWRIAIDHFGLPIAKLYGLTGKILLAVLASEFFALYLIQRVELFPDRAEGFRSFWRGFGSARAGRSRVQWRNLVNFFSFSFALLAPFFFYVALLNSLVESPVYLRFPAMPLVLAFYLGVIVVAYFLTTYRAYTRSSAMDPTREGSGRARSPVVGVAKVIVADHAWDGSGASPGRHDPRARNPSRMVSRGKA